jgi:capsular exopolysaccharide synthesis family protein
MKPLREQRLQKALPSELANGDLSQHLVTVGDPASIASEAYRAMRTTLFYATADSTRKVIALTSPYPGEGKSTTCANLGVVLAQAGKATLAMDCNLRKPALHKVFGLRNFRGVADVLAGERALGELLQEPFPNLKVATAGTIPHNPTELLESERFAMVLHQARRDFDYVLIDSCHVLAGSLPMGPFADPLILAAQADGVLLVLDAQSGRKESLRQAIHALETVGASVLGTVLNNVKE